MPIPEVPKVPSAEQAFDEQLKNNGLLSQLLSSLPEETFRTFKTYWMDGYNTSSLYHQRALVQQLTEEIKEAGRKKVTKR